MALRLKVIAESPDCDVPADNVAGIANVLITHRDVPSVVQSGADHA